nr:MAG TPA: hypothetical protein [Bacteriophage sp.]DAE81298.1 MAG TPA: hypothetical protein [Bacteriophage sp.]DAK05452.1 MAG TPA: hypothetical protein [Caudoviricetes sp.]
MSLPLTFYFNTHFDFLFIKLIKQQYLQHTT